MIGIHLGAKWMRKRSKNKSHDESLLDPVEKWSAVFSSAQSSCVSSSTSSLKLKNMYREILSLNSLALRICLLVYWCNM